MKKIILAMLAAAIFSACNMNKSAPAVDLAKAQSDLMDADKAWNKLAGEVGAQKAVDTYYANEVVALGPNKLALIGKAAVEKDNMVHPDTSKGLSWVAESAEVATSGDMGYTWGKWQYKGPNMEGRDTIAYGVYSTVWKKQADGSWKAVLDHYNNTPKP